MKTSHIFIVLLSWPVIGGLMDLPFFWILVPGLIILVAAIAIEVKDKNLDGAMRTIGGWVVLYMVWSIIYSLITGKGTEFHYPDDPR